MNKQGPLLLGFNRQRWERRKAELRARLAKEHAAPAFTVKSRGQIEAENLSYWISGGMRFLRRKYADEAEAAPRKGETKTPLNSPIGGLPTVTIPKCDTSEGKDSQTLKCDTPQGEVRVCRICGQSFMSTRSDAALCSGRCRKRASRERISVN
jgi:hypothetical protein